jgi:hypothetical protein
VSMEFDSQSANGKLMTLLLIALSFAAIVWLARHEQH